MTKKLIETKDSKALDKVMADITKKFGTNSIVKGKQAIDSITTMLTLERIPTGDISLDVATEGGIPVGRYIQFEGNQSSTKTTHALHLLREAQKLGLTPVFLDYEGTTDTAYLEKIGVDVENLIYARPDGIEEGFQIILDLQKAEVAHIAVIDSLAVAKPTKELDQNIGETSRLGVKQQLVDSFLGKMQMCNNRLSREGKTQFTVIALNQLREKIGALYGDPEYAPGGKAKDFYSSMTVRFRKGDWIKEGTGQNQVIVGHEVKFKISKSKVSKREETGEIDFYLPTSNSPAVKGGYFDNAKSTIILAVEYGLITRGGSWYFLGESKHQGANQLVDFVKERPELVEFLRVSILSLVDGADMGTVVTNLAKEVAKYIPKEEKVKKTK